MAAIARLLARRVPATEADADILKQVALFCCAGLLVSILMMSYGVDQPRIFLTGVIDELRPLQ
jgi:hypothetical protein